MRFCDTVIIHSLSMLAHWDSLLRCNNSFWVNFSSCPVTLPAIVNPKDIRYSSEILYISNDVQTNWSESVSTSQICWVSGSKNLFSVSQINTLLEILTSFSLDHFLMGSDTLCLLYVANWIVGRCCQPLLSVSGHARLCPCSISLSW